MKNTYCNFEFCSLKRSKIELTTIKKFKHWLTKKNVIENDKKKFKKIICDKYSIKKKFIFIDDERIDRILNTIQRTNKIFRKYYERFNKIFVENDDQNYIVNNTLTKNERMFLIFFIKQFINDIRNLKLRQRIYVKYIENIIAKMKNLTKICVFAKKVFNVM